MTKGKVGPCIIWETKGGNSTIWHQTLVQRSKRDSKPVAWLGRTKFVFYLNNLSITPWVCWISDTSFFVTNLVWHLHQTTFVLTVDTTRESTLSLIKYKSWNYHPPFKTEYTTLKMFVPFLWQHNPLVFHVMWHRLFCFFSFFLGLRN